MRIIYTIISYICIKGFTPLIASECHNKHLNQPETSTITHGQVETNQNIQQMNIHSEIWHKKKCTIVLPKISAYENFPSFMPFVSKVKYNEQKQELYMLIESAYLPIKMNMQFIIPRLENVGEYDFTFTHGFLKGLKGKITAIDLNNSCHIHMNIKRSGAPTKYSDLILELFSVTLTKIAVDKIYRHSAI